MNTVIWKYPLEIMDHQVLMMPAASHIMNVADQKGKLCLWAFIEQPEESPHEERHINIFGTGNPISGRPGRYIGTVIISRFVWHVFEDRLTGHGEIR